MQGLKLLLNNLAFIINILNKNIIFMKYKNLIKKTLINMVLNNLNSTNILNSNYLKNGVCNYINGVQNYLKNETQNSDLKIFEKHLLIHNSLSAEKFAIGSKVNINTKNKNDIELNIWIWNLLKDNSNMLLKGFIFASIFSLIIYIIKINYIDNNKNYIDNIDHNKYYVKYEHDKYYPYKKELSTKGLVWVYITEFFYLVRKYGYELALLLLFILQLYQGYFIWKLYNMIKRFNLIEIRRALVQIYEKLAQLEAADEENFKDYSILVDLIDKIMKFLNIK